MERCHRRVLWEPVLVLVCFMSSQIIACKVGDGQVSVFTAVTLFRAGKEKYLDNKGLKKFTEQFHATKCLRNKKPDEVFYRLKQINRHEGRKHN